MSATKLDARFAVGDANGLRSDVWFVTSDKNNIYCGQVSGGSVGKISLHADGKCHMAYHRHRIAETARKERYIHKWRRAPTPPAGSGQASCALSIYFPRDYLSKGNEPLQPPIYVIPPAGASEATVIAMLYSYDSPDALTAQFEGTGTIQVAVVLPSGETFALASFAVAWENRDLIMLASHHETDELRFTRVLPFGYNRLIRLTFPLSEPKDGGSLDLVDIGGYRANDRTPTVPLTKEVATLRRGIIDLLRKNDGLSPRWRP